jgi:CheY-like chemotaxis protein
MGPEEIKRLFRPFSQGDMSTSRRYGGTGLGLAISRQLVDLMKGEIGVESTEGRGSLFRVDLTLPVAAESAERSRTHFDAVRGRHALVVEDNVANRAMLEGQSSADAPPLIRPLTVLVVEDNAVNRHVATAMLQKLGCTVVVADGGEAGVRAARDAAIDLVLMDCQMPEVDGFEATRRIRAEAPDGRVLPIIALTANALHGDRERCLAAGMDDYLAKPFSSRALASMLMTWAPPAKSPPATYSSTAAVLDPGALAEVTALDPDGSLLRRIADVFLTDAPRLAADARAAARDGALDPFVYAVHTLKSCAGTVGARRLSDACHAFERAGREQKALPTEEELQGLDAAVVEAAEALTQLSGARRCSSGGVA